jgi:hypothetical protein
MQEAVSKPAGQKTAKITNDQSKKECGSDGHASDWWRVEAGCPASMRLEERRKMNAIFSRRMDHIVQVFALPTGR